MRAQRIASRLMVELCGAKLVPGTIDVAAEIPAPRAADAARRRGSRACSGWRSPRPTRSPTWSGSASASRPTARTSRSTVPPDRHYDVTREVDLIEEVGRVHGLDEHLPTTLPAVGRPGRRPQPRAAPAAPGRGRACATSASTRSSAGASPTPARPGGCGSPPTTRAPSGVVLANPLSEDQSVMRTTLLGSLLDVAARNLARGADARRPVRVRPRLPARRRRRPSERRRSAGDFAGRAAGAGRRAAPDRLPRRRAAGRRAPGAAAASRPTSSRSRACSRRWPASSASSSRSSRREEPFLHPGRSAAVAVGGDAAGWIGELHPLVCRAWDLEAAVGFEVDLAPLLAAAAGRRGDLRGRHHLPGRLPGPRRRRARPRSPAAAGARGGARRRRRAAALGRGLRPLRGRAARRGAQEPRAAARVPRRRPHPHRRGGRRACATRSRPSWTRSGGRCVTELDAQPLDGEPAARVLVAGASGFTGALAAQIVWRHPRLELVAVDLAQRRRQAARQLYPRYRVPLELTELDLDAARGHRRRDRRLPARRRGADRRRAARPRASSSSTSPPTSGCATCRPTSAGTASTAPPSCSASGVYGLTELYRERAARGGAGRDPRLLPDRERARRWRRWPSRACSPTSSIDAEAGRLRRRARRRRRDALRRR